MIEVKTRITINGGMQEIFDYVVQHLADQKCRSAVENEDGVLMCKYRDDKGRKCAIGCLIPDDLYYTGLENNSVYSFEFDIKDQQFATFLADLQNAHDSGSNYNAETLIRNLAWVADRYKLDQSKVHLIIEWEA